MACYFKFFLTTTTVFVGVFVLLCFFLVIYYLVGAYKGYVRGWLSVTLIRKTRFEKPSLSSAFFLRMLLISSSVVPSYSARAFISSSRSDSSSSVFLQISFMYSSSGRILVVGVFPLFFIICGILSRISLLWSGMGFPLRWFFFYNKTDYLS